MTTDTVKLAKQLIAIPSYVSDTVNEADVIRFLAEYARQNLPAMTVQTSVLSDGRENLYILGKKPPKLVFVGHVDTVQPSDGWRTDPLQPVVKDGASVNEAVPLDGRAVDEMLRIVRENPGEITLLILGPQTNIATAILRDPDTMRQVRELVIMGGAFAVPGNKNRVAEFNICVDPEAAAIVAGFPVKKTYIPLDVCNTIQVPIEEFGRIRNAKIRGELQSMLVPYIANIQRSELPVRGALMYDALAAYFIVKPEQCEVRSEAIVVETKGEYTYGMTLIDRWPFSKKEPANAQIVTVISEQRFIDNYFSLLNL